MKGSTKYISICFMLIMIPITLSAQKEVRKNIRKGNKEYNAQKYSDASSFYGKAVEENPTSQEANYNLGNTFYKQKDWDRAIEFYSNSNALEEEEPLNVSAGMHNIGNAMLRKKELNEAMEAYKMALRLNPQDDETRYNLAVVQKMIQDEEQQQDDGEDDQEQDQQQEQQQDQQESPQNQQDQEKRPEEQEGPEQMSRDNARAMLQAIEQDERETQEKVQKIKAQEREEQAEENRRQNKNW